MQNPQEERRRKEKMYLEGRVGREMESMMGEQEISQISVEKWNFPKVGVVLTLKFREWG